MQNKEGERKVRGTIMEAEQQRWDGKDKRNAGE